MNARSLLFLGVFLLWTGGLPLAAKEPSAPSVEELPTRFREWLDQVEMLITEEEKAYFLTLKEDFRRSAFIAAFWKERDPYPDTPAFNELKVHWDERSKEALSRWGTLQDDRARFFLLHGEPIRRCFHRTLMYEIWTYYEGPEDDTIIDPSLLFRVLFFARTKSSPYERWLFGKFFTAASRGRIAQVPIQEWCGGSLQPGGFPGGVRDEDEPRTAQSLEIPKPSKEWVAAFAAGTTDVDPAARTFSVDLDLEYPGRHQQRTVVQGIVSFAPGDVVAMSGDAGDLHHQFLLLGELVRGGELFESFRYRFELPSSSSSEPLALVFQRYLRPGEFRLLVKVEDLFGRRFAHLDRRIEVPNLVDEAPPEVPRPRLADSVLFRFLDEANEATARGERTLRLLPPPGVVHTGLVRFQALAVGEYDRVDFSIDDQVILSKRRPPYSVELDLGEIPEAHRLRVDGFDAQGQRLATDEILVNPGGQRFRVHLSEPRAEATYRQSLRAVVQVAVPDGDELDRVELYLDELPVATLFQEPYVQPIRLPDSATHYLRAVGYLTDGNSTEDIVFVNAPGEVDEVSIHFVELYATAYDPKGQPVRGLDVSRFRVTEDGEPQEARRFEWVENLPLHVALMIDISASMEESLETVGKAALEFVEDVVKPRDRVTLIPFNHLPHVAARFTSDTEVLARELEALRANGSTSIYDSLIFALYYFNGVKGQKALLLLSDGEDESSRFDFDAAMELARRAGVTVYTIGLAEAVENRDARRVLRQLADETGGRAFFVDDLAELPSIYASIQEELRSQYLFAYQSTSSKDPSEFRRIEVEVRLPDGKKAEVRTMSGYYP